MDSTSNGKDQPVATSSDKSLATTDGGKKIC